MVTKTSIATILCLFIASCIFLERKTDKLTLNRTPYDGNELRIDGYYYQEDSIPGDNVPIYFFYKNGILMHPGGYSRNDFKLLHRILFEKEFSEKSKDINWIWGLYRISNDTISFEKLYPTSGGYEAGIKSGKILNDTTFIITQFVSSSGERRKTKNEIYHFRKFNPKPDSVNNLIKSSN